jgi:hypothetical protein
MIEKLKEHDIIDPKTDKVIGKIGCDLREIMDKLNELVDTINTIQKEREAEWFEIQEWIGILEAVRKSVNVHEKQIDKLQMKVEPEKCEIPVDPFAKQRKWEGKLCWFWDEDPEDKIVDVLSCIDISDKYPYVMCDHQVHYKHCEPVKPDSDIIYKGGDNE